MVNMDSTFLGKFHSPGGVYKIHIFWKIRAKFLVTCKYLKKHFRDVVAAQAPGGALSRSRALTWVLKKYRKDGRQQ